MTEQTKQVAALRLGICGLGRASWGMIYQEIKDRLDIRVVAAADVLPERVAELGKATGARGYDNLEAMLADPAVELVVVATPSRDHTPTAIRALRAGKHVLVEKPIGCTLSEVDELLTEAAEAPGQLLVRHNRRFDMPLLMSQRIIASGKIGGVFRVQLRQGGYSRRADWQTLMAHGGGQLLNWGPHLVDWAMQLVGGPAQDVWSDLQRIAAAGDAEDQVKILIRGASGAIADIEISGCAALPQPGWHVLGTHGGFVIDGNRVYLRYYDAADLKPAHIRAETPPRGTGFAHTEELPWVEETLELKLDNPPTFWHAVVQAIRGEQRFPVTLDEARENMRVIELARQDTAFERAFAVPRMEAVLAGAPQ